MLHKCKMTILDKKLYPELQGSLLRRPAVRPLPLLPCGGPVPL